MRGPMRGLGSLVRDAWRLALPYYRSEERWSARLLLGSIIGMNLMLVAMNVMLNFWNGDFYDSLQNKDWRSFIALLFLGKWDGVADKGWGDIAALLFTGRWGELGVMPGFTLIVCIYIPIAIYRTYLNQWLQIRWRTWLTGRLLDDWLSDRAYYRIQLAGDPAGMGTDNPDQRVADDIRSFVTDTLSLGLGLLSNLFSLYSFLKILWTLSGSTALLGITIPGYMVWVALLYAALGTWVVHLVGRPLVQLNFDQERYEADFRFALVRLRENAEGVALYAGEGEEKRGLLSRFGNIVANWHGIMGRMKLLNALTAGYNQVANIFPIAVASPRYFAGEIALGGLTRISSAFAQVQGSLSWFLDSYSSLASWRATVMRLARFTEAVEAARRAARDGLTVQQGADDLELRDVELKLPTGAPLLALPHTRFAKGRATLVQGRSGSGKSTLFRAIAGIWPFGHGTVQRPRGSVLFLPQRPYIPLGTLRHALSYPGDADRFSDAELHQVLADAGLPHLGDRLDAAEPWAQRLSGGEQQRLALARALLLKPDWLFLDEPTASLDPEAERALYQTLRAKLPGTSIVSIAHSPAVAEYHDARMVLSRAEAGPGRLVAAAAE